MTKDWVHGVGHSPVCQILLQTVVRAVITSSLPAWTSSAGMLSTPADFPFFNDCTAASTSQRRMGWSSSVSVWVQFSIDGSPLALRLYSSEQYSVHRFSICRTSLRHFPERSWTVVAFLCFTVVKSFTSWHALFLTSNTFSLVTPTSGVYQSEQSPRCHRQLVAADYVNGSSLYVVLTTVDFVSTFI